MVRKYDQNYGSLNTAIYITVAFVLVIENLHHHQQKCQLCLCHGLTIASLIVVIIIPIVITTFIMIVIVIDQAGSPQV